MRANLTMKKLILTFILLALLAPVLLAQDRTGDLAVMEMTFSGQGLTRTQIDSLSDLIRAKAVDLTKYRVMTKETNLAILRDKKVDMAKCAEAECVIGRGFGKRITNEEPLAIAKACAEAGLVHNVNNFIKMKRGTRSRWTRPVAPAAATARQSARPNA